VPRPRIRQQPANRRLLPSTPMQLAHTETNQADTLPDLLGAGPYAPLYGAILLSSLLVGDPSTELGGDAPAEAAVEGQVEGVQGGERVRGGCGAVGVRTRPGLVRLAAGGPQAASGRLSHSCSQCRPSDRWRVMRPWPVCRAGFQLRDHAPSYGSVQASARSAG
jgi:hypothetical protein